MDDVRRVITGARRNSAKGKGRVDLMPLDVVADYMEDGVILEIYHYIETKDESHIFSAMDYFIEDESSGTEPSDLAHWMLEVAIHFEDGADTHGPDNWRKGMPLSWYIDSGGRHYLKHMRGDRDERHDRAFLWNMIGLVWTARHIPQMDDLTANKTYELSEQELFRKHKAQAEECS